MLQNVSHTATTAIVRHLLPCYKNIGHHKLNNSFVQLFRGSRSVERFYKLSLVNLCQLPEKTRVQTEGCCLWITSQNRLISQCFDKNFQVSDIVTVKLKGVDALLDSFILACGFENPGNTKIKTNS